MEQGKTSATTASILGLPVFKNYAQNEIVTTYNAVTKGEVKVFRILKLLVFGGITFAVFKWVLPAVFIALGKLFAIVAVICGLIAFVIFLPVLIRLLKSLAKDVDRKLITKDPFAILDQARETLVQGIETTRIGKTKFTNFRDSAQSESEKAESEAKECQRKIVRIQEEVVEMKETLDQMIKEHGKEYCGEDEYIELATQYQKKLAESVRVTNALTQSKDFTERFGARAYTIKKLLQKVSVAETGLEIKLADFDATYEWLKKQYAFAKEAKFVSSQMKDAMTFDEKWQFEFASEVIANTITTDMSVTSSNFKDLESLTAQYNLNSDELYDNLNLLADNINTGKDVVTNAKRYNNTETVLTSSEKIKSGFNGLDF